MAINKNTIKNWFRTGLKPTQAQFWATWDSFWHKDEKLPISQVESLGEVLDNKADLNHSHSQYATNDATSLTDKNVNEWQKKLKVDNLKFDDKAISVTEDYSEFGIKKGETIKSFNDAVYQKLNSDDLGENFANADLNVDEDRTHTGTGTVDLQFPLKFSTLADKSSDKTFDQLAVLNRNGGLAKSSNIANAFENALNNVPKEQSLRIAQLLNGGVGDAGAISVYGISPYMIENKTDNVTWLSVLGANLKLSDVARKLEIIKKSTGEVVATVANDQIVSDSSQELLFYYNFHKWDLDSYTLRISSGVKTYNSDQDFRVVNQLEYIDISKITWEWLYNETEASSKDFANGDSLIAEVPDGASGIPKVNAKSSELFKADEDFIVELQIDQTGIGLSGRDNNSHIIGLGYSNQSNSINKNSLVWLSNNITNLNGYNFKFYKTINISGKNEIANTYFEDDPFSIKVLFIKTGNLIRTMVNGKNTNTIVNNDSGFSIFTQLVGRNRSVNDKTKKPNTDKQIVQAKILRAAKL